MAVVEVDQDAPSVRVASGDVMVLRLPENPATGFVWSISVSDPALLTVESSEFSPSTDQRTAGGGGERVFRLRPLAGSTGDCEVAQVLSRPWEAEPIEKRSLPVEVRERR